MVFQSRSDRRSAILKAARTCFLDRGFVRTTIADILELCGGSRATVYAEFGSKEGLFAALVTSIIEDMALPDLGSGPLEAVLRKFGTSYLDRLLDPDVLALYRVALGESAHVRHLGPALFKAGPERVASALAERLQAWACDGMLDIEDASRAASLFLAMLEGDLHRSALLWARSPRPEAIAANVEAALQLFLRAFGTAQPGLAA
jgi:TetR/AcrR family transcriptional regulator, mexJK operon transcriptional repressor